MKKIEILLEILVALVILSSCADDNLQQTSNQLTASIENESNYTGSNSSSRIIYANDPTSQRMNILWKDRDSIGVFGSKEGKNILYSTHSAAISENGKTAMFTTNESKPTGNLIAYYPYQKNASMSGDELILNMPHTQIFTADGSGIPLPSSEANFMVAKTVEGSEQLIFKNLFALLQINLRLNKDSIIKKVIFTDLSLKPVSGAFSVKWTENEPEVIFPMGSTPANDTLTLDCGEGISMATNDILKFYILVPARDYPKGFQIDLLLDNGAKITKTIGTVAGKTLLKGKLYPIGDTYSQSVGVEYTLNDWVRVVSPEQYQQFSDFSYNSNKNLTFTAPATLGYANSINLILNFTNPLFPNGYAGTIDDITDLPNNRQRISLKAITDITQLFKNLSIGSPLWNTNGTASDGIGLALDLASYLKEVTTYNGTRVPFSVSGSTVMLNVPVSAQTGNQKLSYPATPNSFSLFAVTNASRIMAADKFTPSYTSPPITYTFNDEQALSAKVGIQVTMNTIMSMSVVDQTLEYLHFKATPVVTFTGEFTAQTEKNYEKEVPLLEFHFAPIPVGPIMIVPIMKLNAVADLKGKATLTTTMEYKQEIPFGFSYVPGGFVYRNYLADKDPKDTTEPFKYTGNLQLIGSVAAGAKIYGGFKVFGLLEATANVDSRIRVRCNLDFNAALADGNDLNLPNGYFYEGFSSSKVETLLTPSIGVGITSLGGILNAKSQSEALEIPLSEHYLLPHFANCKFTQTEKGKMEVSMEIKNKLLMGAQLGLRITKNEYWEIVDEIDLGYYSGPPNGANSWILKKTVDVRDDIEIGTKHNVSAIIIINGKKIATPSIGKFLPAWPNSITFTTSKSKGDSIQFGVGLFSGYKTWIDLNNNQLMEDNEYIYNVGQKFAVNSQTITVHGLIRSFICDGQQITNLDLSNCPNIESVKCTNNELTKLDISSCPSIKSVDIRRNNINSFITAANAQLSSLLLSDNRFTNFTLNSKPELTTLALENNLISNLNVSNNPKLATFTFSNNPLININASNCVTLPDISYSEGNLSQLNISGCTTINSVKVSKNQLQTINLTGCKALKNLYCEENRISSLSMTDATELELVNCSNNLLVQLDLRTNTKLKTLLCNTNQIASINAQNCTALGSMSCSYNTITQLTLTNCTSLYSLVIDHNQLFGSASSHIMDALPDRTGKSTGNLYFEGNSGYNSALETAAGKNWSVSGGTWTKDE